MKSMISRSLIPCFIFSRTSFLRSTASPALESAMVWFWHTRQRNSPVSAVTRCSSAGSCAAGAASLPSAAVPAISMSISARTLATIELAHQRENLFLQDLGRDRPDLLVANHSALVDHVGFRDTVDAVIDADPALDVVRRQLIR